MAQMTDERRSRIALILWETKILEEGMIAPRKLGDELHTMSKKSGISVDELKRFYQSFFPSLYGRMFGYEDVTINASSPR